MAEKEKNSKTKKIVIFSLCLITIVFACILGTYAYFMVNISNNERQEVQLDTGTMRLRFADGNPTINQNIMLGETVEKKFTIENTGDLDASLSIEWLDIVNSYMEGSLTYTLEQSETEGSGYTEIISKTNVPTTDSAFTTTLAPDLEIPAGKTYYYNLKITFNDLEGIDQEADRDAKLTTKFTVSQPSTNRSYSLVIDPNGGILGDTNTVQTLTKRNGTTETIGIPKKAGVNFKGWKVIGMGSVLSDGTLTMGKSNTKVIAEWETFNVVEAVKAVSNGQTPKGVKRTEHDISELALTDEGVYSMEDDYGMSYYYRGAVSNNYLKFGDFYWRIIRVNGDGSLRIMYDGTEAHENGDSSIDRVAKIEVCYNCLDENYLFDAKQVGWMFGGAKMEVSTSKEQATRNENNSDAKIEVDNWYRENIENKNLSKYVADSIFCNDRSTSDKNTNKISWDTSLGYGLNKTIYGTAYRTSFFTDESVNLSFKCPQKNDAFTVEDKVKGNGDLTYPVGLVTVDEIMAAAGKIGYFSNNNRNFYMYNHDYADWTMSPISVGTSSVNTPTTVGFLMDGIIGWAGTNVTYDNYNGKRLSVTIRPVINLKKEYVSTMIGAGTMSNPYRNE